MSAPEHTDLPLKGIALVVLSTVFSSLSDLLAKLLAADLPGTEVLWIRYCCFLLILIAVIKARGKAEDFVTKQPRLQVMRGVLVVISAILFILGLQFLPISEATTTFYISPMFVTALSIVFLNESVGVRRWIATLIGLFGVVLVVRPGTSAFHVAALLPIGSAIFWAGTLIITRKLSGLENAYVTLFSTAVTGLIMLSLLVPFHWRTPSWPNIWLGILIGITATIGQTLIIAAYRYASASVLAPFSYVQIIWAVILGFLVFAEIPDFWSFIGAAIIIASGVYTAQRERVRHREAMRAAAEQARNTP